MRGNILVKINLLIRVIIIKVFLELKKRHLISVFKSSIVIAVLLNRIICKVDEFISNVFKGEICGTGSYIALFVPVSLLFSVDGGDHHEATEVEFSFFK